MDQHLQYADKTCNHTSWYKKHWVPYTKRASQHGSSNSSTTTPTASSRKQHKIAQIRSTVIEYYRATAFIDQAASDYIREQQPRTGNDGHRSNMVQQRQGYNSYSYNHYAGGKGKCNQQPVGQTLSKDNKDMAKRNDEDTATTNKACNKCLLQMWTAERRPTTTPEPSIPMIRQMTGTVRHTTTTTGTTRTRHRCINQRYHNHHRQQIHQQYPSQDYMK